MARAGSRRFQASRRAAGSWPCRAADRCRADRDSTREAQVVADQRTHPPAVHLEQGLLQAWRVVLVLTGHAEQVALVVMQHLTIGTRPEQAVAMAAVGGLDDHAAGDDRIQPRRLAAQPGIGRALFRLGQAAESMEKPVVNISGRTIRSAPRAWSSSPAKRSRLASASCQTRWSGSGQFEIGQVVQIAHSRSAA